MNEERFWRLIEDSNAAAGGDADAQLERLRAGLEEFPAAGVAAFDEIFSKFYRQSYDWKLWAAAYLINGGCSDDGFDYFRAGLILQGRKVFAEALADPETLAAVVAFEDGELAASSQWAAGVEEALYLPAEIYEEKTGAELTRAFVPYREPAGEPWEESEVEALLPKLARLCDEGTSPGGAGPENFV